MGSHCLTVCVFLSVFSSAFIVLQTYLSVHASVSGLAAANCYREWVSEWEVDRLLWQILHMFMLKPTVAKTLFWVQISRKAAGSSLFLFQCTSCRMIVDHSVQADLWGHLSVGGLMSSYSSTALSSSSSLVLKLVPMLVSFHKTVNPLSGNIRLHLTPSCDQCFFNSVWLQITMHFFVIAELHTCFWIFAFKKHTHTQVDIFHWRTLTFN